MPSPAQSKAAPSSISEGEIFLPGVVKLEDLTNDFRDVRFRVWPVRYGVGGLAELTREERLVFSALGDRKWDWRTLAGLEKSTGLKKQAILDFLTRYSDKIEQMESEKFGTLYRLKSRWKSITEWLMRQFDRALDYISLGMRSHHG